MNVQLKPPGCVERLGAVLSFGLLPLVRRSVMRQYPATLTDDTMILRNGTRIAWSAFTRFRHTDAYVQGVYVNTTYELWHAAGRLHFSTRQIVDADAVVRFVLGHLPAEVTAGRNPE